MSDPISAGLQIFCSAIGAASAIADFADKHRIREKQRVAAAQKARLNVKSTTSTSVVPSWQKGKLPAGWEMRLTKDKRVYFVNHTTKTTTWIDPRNPKQSIESGKQTPATRIAQGAENATGNTTEITQDTASSSSDELFLVLGTLGQRLIAIGVIEDSNVPTAHSTVSKSMPTFSKELSTGFDELDTILQYAITCAVFFCAACYPMHIYRGFGCGVLDDVTWGIHPLEVEWAGYGISERLTAMDKFLSYLKSLPLNLKLLKKSPKGVDKTLPQYESLSKESEELNISVAEEYLRAIERCGFPEPRDKRVIVKSWRVPFARRRGKLVYSDDHRLLRDHLTVQMDAGRFLFAWLVWNRLDLCHGELLQLTEKHIIALAEWLEGLTGMTFKLLSEEEFDWTNISFAPWLAEKFVKATGNEHGLVGLRCFVALDPKYDTCTSELAIENQQSVSEQPEIEPQRVTPWVGSALSQGAVRTLAHRRLPPPLPPPLPDPTYRLAKAKFSFQSADSEEMSFAAEDVLEILDDKRNDGWWMARLDIKIGLVPASYLS